MQDRHIPRLGVRSAWKIAVMSRERSTSNVVASQAFVLDSTSIDEITERLTDAVVARILDLIRMEGLIERAGSGQRWLDAQEVAQRLGVSREWVYEHADELGARRIGSGRRPRLRFPALSLDRPANGFGVVGEHSEPSRLQRRPGGLIPVYEE
jgi:predicted DNA-binding transcriptional regulator AlpA